MNGIPLSDQPLIKTKNENKAERITETHKMHSSNVASHLFIFGYLDLFNCKYLQFTQNNVGQVRATSTLCTLSNVMHLSFFFFVYLYLFEISDL